MSWSSNLIQITYQTCQRNLFHGSMSYYAIPYDKEHASVSWTTHFDTNIFFELNLAIKYRYFNILPQVGITDDFDYLELAPIVPQGPVGDHILEGNP